MNRNRRIAFLRKKIEDRDEQIKRLHDENRLLKKENSLLRDGVSTLKKELLEKSEAYKSHLDDLNEIRSKYANIVSEVSSLKEQYRKEMGCLIKKIKQ